MNFNEVLIKDSQLTRRWGNGKVFKGNVSGGHALFANQVLSGINQQVHQYFYFVCAIMASVTRSLQTVL